MHTDLTIAPGPFRTCTPPTLDTTYPLINAGENSHTILWDFGELPEQCWIMTGINELPRTLSRTIPDDEIDDLIAEVEELLYDAAHGRLRYGARQDVVEVRRHETLAEMRLHEPFLLAGENYQGRIYYAEPNKNLFEGIVTLCFHLKQNNNQTLNFRQNSYMDLAACRVEDWAQVWSANR